MKIYNIMVFTSKGFKIEMKTLKMGGKKKNRINTCPTGILLRCWVNTAGHRWGRWDPNKFLVIIQSDQVPMTETKACAGHAGLIPGSGRSSWRRKWQPTPVFLPGDSHGQRSLAGRNPRGRSRIRLSAQAPASMRTLPRKLHALLADAQWRSNSRKQLGSCIRTQTHI